MIDRPSAPASPGALVKPPLPGRERLLLRAVVVLAWILVLCGPQLPWVADQIPGQSSTRPAATAPAGAVPPQRQLANLLRTLSRSPATDILLAVAVLGGFGLALEAALAASMVVRERYAWRQLQATYLRLRPLRPQSRKGSQHESAPRDLWRSLATLDRALRQGPRCWLALTLTALPEEPVTLGAVTVAAAAPAAATLARMLESLLLGQDAELVVDRPPDPLATLPSGAVLIWQELTLTRPAHAPLRSVDDADADLLGAVAAALRTPAGVCVAEVQVIPMPRRDTLDTPWRVRARRRLVDLRKRQVFGMSAEQQQLETKLDHEAFDLTIRLVVVAESRASMVAAQATMRDLLAAFGQYQQRTGIGLQRLVAAPLRAGHVVLPAMPRPASAWLPMLPTMLGMLGCMLAGILALPHGRLALLLAVAGMLGIWVAWRGAWQLWQQRWRVATLRTPGLPFPERILLPFPGWASPNILGIDEVAGLWHLPSVRLHALVQWLPNRHLPAQPHVFLPAQPNQPNDRIVLGEARTRDGGMLPVGPSLRDLRQVLHITAGMGAGKSRALANIAAQVIQQVHSGLLLLDGKGDDAGCLAATVRSYIPREQEQQLMLIDVLDAEWPIGLNPFYGIDTRKAGGATQALGIVLALLARLDPELMQRSMGMIQFIQMGTILIVEGEEAPTFASLKQCLEDETYRAELLQHCTNLEVVNFWTIIYPETSEQQRNSLNALLRRFDNLLVDETTRYLLTQPHPTIDFLRAMEQGAIILAPLPHRTLGGMAEFIGMLLLQAMMRAAFQRPGSDQSRRTIPLMIDELQVFIGRGESPDIRDAVTQLRGFGIAGIYAHQTLHQLGELRDELLTNSASRLILRTQEPDASAYAKQYPTTDLTPADISGQHPQEHQYAILASAHAPAEVFSLRPRLWPTPVAADVEPLGGMLAAWQTMLPPGADALDQQILELVYHCQDVAHVSAQLALMPEDEWRFLLARWQQIRQYQRQYLVDHPGCVPDRFERQQWLSRLLIATPRVLAAAVYQRQRWAIDPTEKPPAVRARQKTNRDPSAPSSTAMHQGITPTSPVEPTPVGATVPVGSVLQDRQTRRRQDDPIDDSFGHLR